MRHAISRSRTACELAISSVVAAVSGAAVLLFGAAGAVLLLGPEDAEAAGISFGGWSSH